jgi:hypothetical protein
MYISPESGLETPQFVKNKCVCAFSSVLFEKFYAVIMHKISGIFAKDAAEGIRNFAEGGKALHSGNEVRHKVIAILGGGAPLRRALR